VIHVCPENDLREHIVKDDLMCPCMPMIWTDEDGNDRAVHNSYDGREVGDVMLDVIEALGRRVRGEWPPVLRSKYDHAKHLILMHWPKAEIYE